MHLDKTVVTIVDANRKPLRELASTRTQPGGRMCDINLPFDSEYQFLVKNGNTVRVKVEIDIDGTCVTGGGLILDGSESCYIERFVDSARKFKFVRATHEAVADPTAPDNGSIRVKVTREYQHPEPARLIPHRPLPWNDSNPFYYGGPHRYSYRDTQITCCSGDPSRVLRSMSLSNTAIPCATSHFTEERGATVEGGKSDQVFGTTTWAGDAPLSTIEFIFNLHCRTAQEEAEYQEFLRLKAKFG